MNPRAAVLVLLAGCGAADEPAETHVVAMATADAYGQPLPGLDAKRAEAFFAGNALFRGNWVAAPASVEGRDGLGPLHNALSCSACHPRDGRGRPDGEGLLLRIDRHPVYGDQIQTRALPGVRPEGRVRVTYEEVAGAYADGTAYRLRRPTYAVEDPAYGPVSGPYSPRLAPAMFGCGLLEAIPEGRLRELADPDDRDGDGISGRLGAGRFGWTAARRTVVEQTAAALNGDLGLTSPLFPEENSTTVSASPRTGGPHEVDAETLRLLAFYVKTLAVPARRRPDDPLVRRGEGLFRAAGCAACHVPEHVTGEDPEVPDLSRRRIRPYTDLLLHDMGPELQSDLFLSTSDEGLRKRSGQSREWRTPPLWGLGLLKTVNGHTFLLHDGRARDAAEAVLWHGGEAEPARERFRRMSAEDRAALLAFLDDL